MATRARRLPKSDAGPRQSSRGGGRETPMMSALNKTWDGQDINGLADQSLLKDVYLEFARFGSREPLVDRGDGTAVLAHDHHGHVS